MQPNFGQRVILELERRVRAYVKSKNKGGLNR